MKKYIVVFLVSLLITPMTGCIFSGQESYHIRFKVEISNAEEPLIIHMPIAIISSDNYSPDYEGEPIELYTSLNIITGSGDFQIISINDTYYLRIISDGNISLGFDKSSSKYSKKNVFSKISAEDVHLNNSKRTPVHLDYSLYSRDSGSDAIRSYNYEGVINYGWQTVRFH